MDVMNEIINLLELNSYEFTEHALDRMAEYSLDEEEVLTAIKQGFIYKKQRDKTKEAHWVYSLLGDTETRYQLYIAGKIIRGKLHIFKIISAKEDEG